MACFSRHSAAKVITTRTGEVNTSKNLRDVACSDHSKVHGIASPVSSLNWSTLARKGGDIIVMFCKQYTCRLGTLAGGRVISLQSLANSVSVGNFSQGGSHCK